jgi:hypothetical protein
MKTPVNLIIDMIDGCYDPLNHSNTFDLGVQYMTNSVITFPRVEEQPGSGQSLPGCKSYPVFKGLVPRDFDGGSFTWKSASRVEESELYSLRK